MTFWTRKKKSSAKPISKGDRGRVQKAKKTVKRSPGRGLTGTRQGRIVRDRGQIALSWAAVDRRRGLLASPGSPPNYWIA
jgi:hypothetical protein